MNQDVIATKLNLHDAEFLDMRGHDPIIIAIMIVNTIQRERYLLKFHPRLNNLE